MTSRIWQLRRSASHLQASSLLFSELQCFQVGPIVLTLRYGIHMELIPPHNSNVSGDLYRISLASNADYLWAVVIDRTVDTPMLAGVTRACGFVDYLL